MRKSRGRLYKALLIIFILILLGTFTSCSYSAEGKLIFGTFFDMELKGKNASKTGEEIETTLIALEEKLSTNIVTSDINKINESDKDIPLSVSKDTLYLLQLSKNLYVETEKAFNPAMFPIVELWNMSPSRFILNKSIPDQESITNALKYTDFDDITIDELNFTVTKKYKEQKLDLGAIAKGYAVKLAMDKCINLSTALINAGGTISYLGGSVKIGILDPRGDGLLGSVNLNGNSIATSGDYERFFIKEGIRYHHIFDRNGYPAGLHSDNKIISVSVIASDATIADALSTSLFILGSSYINLIQKYNASAIFVYEDKTVEIIGNADFSLINTEYTINA